LIVKSINNQSFKPLIMTKWLNNPDSSKNRLRKKKNTNVSHSSDLDMPKILLVTPEFKQERETGRERKKKKPLVRLWYQILGSTNDDQYLREKLERIEWFKDD
jgi:hypothetical protein